MTPGPKHRRASAATKSVAGVPAASAVHVRRRMQVTPRRDTPPELALRRALHQLGHRFWVDHALPFDRRKRADLLFPSARVAVFVDGCFWHGCPKHVTWPKSSAAWWRAKIEGNRVRDRRTNRALRRRGWAVVRVWEHQEVSVAAQRVATVLAAAQRRKGHHPPGAPSGDPCTSNRTSG